MWLRRMFEMDDRNIRGAAMSSNGSSDETGLAAAWSVDMSDADFCRLASVVESHLGIKMPPTKKSMVASRLRRRLRELGLNHYREYYDYLQSAEGSQLELPYFSDLITTHKTSFFREADQFEVLSERILPEFLSRAGGRRPLAIWSAGCSTGEEVYTLRMVLEEFRSMRSGATFQVALLGTDVSEFVLEKARRAVYDAEAALSIPQPLRSKYLLRSKDSSERLVRVAPALRTHVDYVRLNLNDRRWDLRRKFHTIFCRNVLIYFDAKNQNRIIEQLCQNLEPGGYLFLGLSEGIGQSRLPLTSIARSVYRWDPPGSTHLPSGGLGHD
jgi:chemotaxis protein methyltransferase CheR